MVLPSALERLVPLLGVQPGTGVEETLLLAAAVLLVVALAAVLVASVPVASAGRAAFAFADVRVLLGSSRATARGHRMARAPGGAT